MSLIDKGTDQGMWFELSTEYFGYPGLHASMQIDQHAIDFLDKMQLLIDSARADIKKIDWEKRYS
jgi:hypothetical protein